MPMAILFGWPAILGLAIGAGIGNLGADALSGFAPTSIGIDIVGGSLANLVATFLAWKIGGLGWRADGRTFWALGTLGLALATFIALQPFASIEWIALVMIAWSGILAYFIGRKGWATTYGISWPLATAIEAIVISIVVGSYLSVVLPFPESFQASVLGVLFGSIIAVNIGGLLLLNVIGQAETLKMFKSWGVTVYDSPTREKS